MNIRCSQFKTAQKRLDPDSLLLKSMTQSYIFIV